VNVLDVLGRLGNALALGYETLPLAEAADDPDVLLRLQRNLAQIHIQRGEFTASQGCLARALELAARLGDPAQGAFALTQKAWVAIVVGEWASARATLDEAATLLRADARSWYAPYVPIYRAFLALAAGDRVAAAARVVEAEAALGDSPNQTADA